MADGRRSRKRACRARRMKDAVVRAPKKFSDADADFVAGDACCGALMMLVRALIVLVSLGKVSLVPDPRSAACCL